MPINDNKELISSFICAYCDGDGRIEQPSCDIDEECENCKGTGFVELSSVEWFKESMRDITSNKSGLYTFEDMMRAFKLGVMAESGQLSPKDYIPTELLIEKFFKHL
jgi:hypothetical protein